MSKRVRIVATVVGCAFAAYLVARLFAHADPSATWRAIGSHGLLVALAPTPFAAGMAIDAYGTVVLLRALGRPTTLAQMLPVRIASEALHIGVPAGFVASDTVTAVLLEARCDIPVRDGVVASIARRWLAMRAHGAYIALGALIGFPALTWLSRGPFGGRALPWLVLASAAIPLGASWVLGAGLLGRSTFATLHAALARVPSKRLGRWLEARRSEALATDAQVARLRAAWPATTVATLSFLACWCVEALESAFLLRLVGGDVAFGAVLAIEGGLSLVRAAAVVAPSGLGVVDFGYATLLPMLGVDAGGAARVRAAQAREGARVGHGGVHDSRRDAGARGRPLSGDSDVVMHAFAARRTLPRKGGMLDAHTLVLDGDCRCGVRGSNDRLQRMHRPRRRLGSRGSSLYRLGDALLQPARVLRSSLDPNRLRGRRDVHRSKQALVLDGDPGARLGPQREYPERVRASVRLGELRRCDRGQASGVVRHAGRASGRLGVRRQLAMRRARRLLQNRPRGDVRYLRDAGPSGRSLRQRARLSIRARLFFHLHGTGGQGSFVRWDEETVCRDPRLLRLHVRCSGRGG
jgi:hypothetical protein